MFIFATFQIMNTHNATIKFLVLSHWRFSKVLRAGWGRFVNVTVSRIPFNDQELEDLWDRWLADDY